MKQSLLIFDQDWLLFFTRPIVVALFVVTALSLMAPLIVKVLRRAFRREPALDAATRGSSLPSLGRPSASAGGSSRRAIVEKAGAGAPDAAARSGCRTCSGLDHAALPHQRLAGEKPALPVLVVDQRQDAAVAVSQPRRDGRRA